MPVALATQRTPILPAALQEIAAAAKQLSAGGDVSQAKVVLERLDGIGSQLTAAWSQHNARPARRAVQALALAVHNLQAAEAVRRAVSPGAQLAGAGPTCRPVSSHASLARPRCSRHWPPCAGWRPLPALSWDTATPKRTLPDGRPESKAVLAVAAQVRQELQMLDNAKPPGSLQIPYKPPWTT